MRYYVLTDIHGFYSLCRQTLAEAGYDDDTGEKKLLLLGDVLDRGQEPEAMQDWLLELLREDRVILVRGNHEDLFEALVTTDRGRALRHHLHNGTYETALRLTGVDPGLFRTSGRALAAAGRETPFYKTIIPAAQDYYETEHYIFVHAWIPVTTDWEGRAKYDPKWRCAGPVAWKQARWINPMDAAAFIRGESKTVVCGHYHCSYGHAFYEKRGSEFGPDADFSPYRAPGVIALDACTAFSGKMNCLVIED